MATKAFASYFVEWTPGHTDREATFDLILGQWGEGTDASNRKAVSLRFRHTHAGPQFMVWNASARPMGTNALVSEALDRDQVLGTAFAEDAFAVVDLVYLTDNRLDELRQT